MKKVRRLLACILAASMLIGANGVSYAAETADGGSAEAVEESVAEIRSEDTEDSSSDASGEFADAEESGGNTPESQESEDASAAGTTAEIAAEVEPGSTSVITAVAVDQNGEVIKGYETVSLPAFDTQQGYKVSTDKPFAEYNTLVYESPPRQSARIPPEQVMMPMHCFG